MDLFTYGLQDFVPFTSEVYHRLFERLNTDYFPAPVLSIVIALVLLVALRRDYGRLAGFVLGASWAWLGWAYYSQLYSRLNWAGDYFTLGCYVQASLMVFMGLSGRLTRELKPTPSSLSSMVFVAALVLVPALSLVDAITWQSVQLFGQAPGVTALFTIGVGIGYAKPGWPIVLIPLLIATVSGATALVLGSWAGLATALIAWGALLCAGYQRLKSS